ncbi:hypothetical protein [uncultured Roseobacter sp.]|uniref:hypothetical protein n=1 Tax=uncultured Roseobacter sp. TaxID=114847 RepID=UPI00261325DD|nr:hypothetical protein [uncultured Roseobacter sp.]
MTTTIHSARPETLTNASVPEEDSAADKIKSAVADAGEKITDRATKLQGEATVQAERAVATAADSVEDLQAGLNEVGRRAREGVEKQPLMAVAGALAVGVVVGMALSRNRY